MCVESKSKLLATFRCPCCGNFTCMLNAKLLDIRFHENPRLWWWSSSLLTTHAKIGYTSSSFLSFMFCFRFCKAHNMLAMMLDPRCKGLGLVMQYVGKERAFQILGEYDRLILFMFLVCAYKFLNLTNVSERVLYFASESSQSTSLYDLMEIDENMTLSVVKEQLTHFKIKKVIEEECKGSICMVESPWSTLFICRVCRLTNFGYCRFPNSGRKSF